MGSEPSSDRCRPSVIETVAVRGLALAVALTATLVAGQPRAEDWTPVGAELAGVSASRVYFDPDSERLTTRRPPGVAALALSEAEARMVSRSPVGLAEVPLPDGGSYVDLGGRFRHLQAVSIGPDGRLTSHCFSAAAAGEAQDER